MRTVAAAAPVTTLTRLDVALPFWVAAIIVLIAAVFEDFVTEKVSSVLHAWATTTGEDLKSHGDLFQPEGISKVSEWAIDTAQVVPTVLAPLIGVVLLWKQGAKSELALVMLGIVFFALIAFRHFWKKPPDQYGAGWPWIFTPLTVLALVLNVGGGGIAFAIGP